MSKTEIDNTQDVIDSRDVIARIEELEGERESLMDAWGELIDMFEDVGDGSTLSILVNGYSKNPKDATAVAMLSDYLEENGGPLDDARQAISDWEDENAAELKALRAELAQVPRRGAQVAIEVLARQH